MNEPNEPKKEIEITGDANSSPDFEAIARMSDEEFEKKLAAGELDIEPEDKPSDEN